jgi:signal peptidase I
MVEETPDNSPDTPNYSQQAEWPSLPLLPSVPMLPAGSDPYVASTNEPAPLSESLPSDPYVAPAMEPPPLSESSPTDPYVARANEPAWPRESSSTGLWPSSRSREKSAQASSEFVWSDARLRTTYPPWMTEEAATYLPARPKTRFGIRLGRIARDLIETVILALLIFVGVRAMVQNFRVEGSSMEGTLHDGQYILVNKAFYFKVDLSFLDFLPFYDAGDNPVHYIFGAPRRGDVVVFRFPNQPDRDFIKRIIAVPGETVQVKEGLVYINDKPLDENYILERPNYNYGPEVVPDGEYFVLGDNRNNSYDSRSWGFVPEKNIIGRAWVSYLPLDSFGFISDPKIQPMGTQAESP